MIYLNWILLATRQKLLHQILVMCIEVYRVILWWQKNGLGISLIRHVTFSRKVLILVSFEASFVVSKEGSRQTFLKSDPLYIIGQLLGILFKEHKWSALFWTEVEKQLTVKKLFYCGLKKDIKNLNIRNLSGTKNLSLFWKKWKISLIFKFLVSVEFDVCRRCYESENQNELNLPVLKHNNALEGCVNTVRLEIYFVRVLLVCNWKVQFLKPQFF